MVFIDIENKQMYIFEGENVDKNFKSHSIY